MVAARTKRGKVDNRPRGSPKSNEKEKIRLSLDVSTEMNELLERLADATGGTKSDVLRRAVALMEVLVEAKRQGKKFGIAEKDQPLATEIIGL